MMCPHAGCAAACCAIGSRSARRGGARSVTLIRQRDERVTTAGSTTACGLHTGGMPRFSASSSSAGRPVGSRVLHVIDRAASRPAVAAVVVAADLLWVGYSALAGFPSQPETVFQTLVGALTLAMVFVIQHTQAREQVTFQRKLDEILRALPSSDKTLLALEDASDDALAASSSTHRDLRQEALDVAGVARNQSRAENPAA